MYLNNLSGKYTQQINSFNSNKKYQLLTNNSSGILLSSDGFMLENSHLYSDKQIQNPKIDSTLVLLFDKKNFKDFNQIDTSKSLLMFSGDATKYYHFKILQNPAKQDSLVLDFGVRNFKIDVDSKSDICLIVKILHSSYYSEIKVFYNSKVVVHSIISEAIDKDLSMVGNLVFNQYDNVLKLKRLICYNIALQDSNCFDLFDLLNRDHITDFNFSNNQLEKIHVDLSSKFNQVGVNGEHLELVNLQDPDGSVLKFTNSQKLYKMDEQNYYKVDAPGYFIMVKNMESPLSLMLSFKLFSTSFENGNEFFNLIDLIGNQSRMLFKVAKKIQDNNTVLLSILHDGITVYSQSLNVNEHYNMECVLTVDKKIVLKLNNNYVLDGVLQNSNDLYFTQMELFKHGNNLLFNKLCLYESDVLI